MFDIHHMAVNVLTINLRHDDSQTT